jgi:sortase (surface protein transpeptidase)
MKNRSWLNLAAAAAVVGAISTGLICVLAAPSGWLNIDGLQQFNTGGAGAVDWANSGPAGAACANGGVNITGSGGIFNCGRPGTGTNPPVAPTRTAAAAADPTIISSVFVVDPISGDTAGCGGDDPTTLSGGGPKNGDAINSYSVGAGTVPAKTELSNVYAVAHTKVDGHPEVYFAAERLVNNGDSHMDFEFLQSAITRTAACGGGFVGHRSEGDLLVAVDFTNGGALAGFSVWQWHCAAEPGPQPADGTVCDPNGVSHYEQNLAPAFADLQVNAALIPCGGWVCRDQVTGNATQVATNNFLEGGVDLEGIPFTGCFRSFLPHTRTAQSFTSVLKDFAGPVTFHSCKDPGTTSNSAPTGAVSAGTSATDTVNVTNGGAGPDPAGTITFFLCNPGQVSAGGCVSGGTQVGAVKTIVAGSATSDPGAPAQINGKWCWRTQYTPDASMAGIYEAATHTNATTECFTVSGGVNLPNTGIPDLGSARALVPLAGLVGGPLLLLSLAWRRGRGALAVILAGLVASASPASPSFATDGVRASGPSLASIALAAPSPSPVASPAAEPRPAGWRLVIPKIGVDALIQPVGLDRSGAMASPTGLETVGWFNRGASPGKSGDAVIDGHYGTWNEPGVFRELRRLQPGDAITIVWPDGRSLAFRVAAAETVASDAHPRGLFGRSGPSRMSLITCSGQWDPAARSYTDRLIVTAVPA